MEFLWKILIGGVLLVLCGIALFIFIISSPFKYKPPTTPPANVSKTAVWRGGPDRGFWYELVDINVKKKTYHIKIYSEEIGELMLDADYILEDNCNYKYPLSKSISKYIFDFNFNDILLHIKDIDSSYCTLKMIKPAYGGTFWEIDKKQ